MLPRSLDEDQPAGGLDSLSFCRTARRWPRATRPGTYPLGRRQRQGRSSVPGRSGPIDLLAFAPDGKSLLGPQRVWDAATGKELRRLPTACRRPPARGLRPGRQDRCHPGSGRKGLPDCAQGCGQRGGGSPLRAGPEGGGVAAFAPDGKLLASATGDGASTCGIRRPASASGPSGETGRAQELRGYNLHLGSFVVAFAPDGKTVAASGFSFGVAARPRATLGLWDVASGKHLRDLTGEGRLFIDFVTFSPDGKLLVTWGPTPAEDQRLGGGDRQAVARLARPARGRFARGLLPGRQDPGDGGGGRPPAGVAVGRGHGQGVRSPAGARGGVLTLTFSPDGKTLASGSQDTRPWSGTSANALSPGTARGLVVVSQPSGLARRA